MTYGLGSESQNLPAFVVMYDTLGRGMPKGHAQNWGAGFLPEHLSGHRPQAARRPHRQPQPPGRDERRRSSAAQLDLLARLNKQQLEQGTRPKPELSARIETFELAYRMQMAAPEALDLTSETEADAEALRPRQPEVRRTSPSSA